MSTQVENKTNYVYKKSDIRSDVLRQIDLKEFNEFDNSKLFGSLRQGIMGLEYGTLGFATVSKGAKLQHVKTYNRVTDEEKEHLALSIDLKMKDRKLTILHKFNSPSDLQLFVNSGGDGVAFKVVYWEGLGDGKIPRLIFKDVKDVKEGEDVEEEARSTPKMQKTT